MDRRDFVGTSLSSLLLGACGFSLRTSMGSDSVQSERKPVKVAAVQYEPILGDVAANLRKAQVLVREAFAKNAKWVVLPEFFTSANGMHESIEKAHRPLNGEPMEFLKRLAREGDAYVGGSFLAEADGDIYNTFVLACPDGSTFTHDKDFPSTIYESSLYAGGEDTEYVRWLKEAGVDTKAQKIQPRQGNNVRGCFGVGDLSIGVAMCWEQVRYRTARRLAGRIDMLLGASGWWWSDPEFGWPGDRTTDEIRQSREAQEALIREAPRRLARMLGVPVVNANFCGLNQSFLTHELQSPVTGKYLGESQIVDGDGRTVARMRDKEGIVVANVVLGRRELSEEISSTEEWMPEMTERARQLWSETGAQGRDYYLENVRPRLRP